MIFLLRIPPERVTEFLDAYERIRYQVAGGVDGHLVDQVCRSATDPEQWLITSEWRSMADFEAWERSPGHRELAGPLRACATQARSSRFEIWTQTGSGPPDPTPVAPRSADDATARGGGRVR